MRNISEKTIQEYRRVAYYYYKVGLTQEEIAKRMRMSRQRVNRIVNSCVDLGIVKITVEDLDKCNLELETKLEQKYSLDEVRIVESIVGERMIQELGIAAGNYLKSILQEGDTIGVTRGRTTAAMVDYWVPAASYPDNMTVTQLIGSGKEEDSHLGVDRIVYRLAERIGARESIIYAPVIVHSAELKESFVEDPYYVDAYKVMKDCSVAVVGIGTAHSQWKHMVSLYDRNVVEQTKWAENVVGEVCTHFFDKDGGAVIPPFSNRIISINLEDYKKIPVRIGVAGGEEKIEAIRAALKGGYVNVLISDFQTAELLTE
ncbi:MAG: sugar-binding transcriptional regulator [Coprococcus sp.]|nr:sugar-binding transcriptional regulator [Coprococcus sp.]